MAKMIHVSASYLSQVERGLASLPTEEKLRLMAGVLEVDPDWLLSLVGRVSQDLLQIIRERPREMAALIRACGEASTREIEAAATGLWRPTETGHASDSPSRRIGRDGSKIKPPQIASW
jgi:transcriptional regulator with XRE-family HTH domain